MSATQTLPKPASAGRDDRLPLHVFCSVCWPVARRGNIALCGWLSSGDGPKFWMPPADWPLCVVCVDLVGAGCPKCGAEL